MELLSVKVDGQWVEIPSIKGEKGDKGDAFTYEDLTDAQKAELVQGPILEARTDAVTAVGNAGTTQTQAVNTAGNTQVQAVNTAGNNQVSAVNTKGQEVLASIPSDYSEMTDEVRSIKSAFNNLPTEETGQELLDKETGNAGLAETALAVIGLLFDRMPQNETATDIYYSLLLENERLLAIYEIWEAERSA